MSVSLDNLEPIDVRPIKRALISVYDKTGLEDLARALGEAGVEIVSTGSTAARIAAAGVAVTPVDDVTGFPEVLEGRVKTLHPFIHSGILADQRKAAHREQIAQLGIKAFDLVVCNLYPFQDTVASGASFDECVEQIDIGGPSMVRAAAKNRPSVAVVTSPERYADVAQAVAGEGFTLEQRPAPAPRAPRALALRLRVRERQGRRGTGLNQIRFAREKRNAHIHARFIGQVDERRAARIFFAVRHIDLGHIARAGRLIDPVAVLALRVL